MDDAKMKKWNNKNKRDLRNLLEVIYYMRYIYFYHVLLAGIEPASNP